MLYEPGFAKYRLKRAKSSHSNGEHRFQTKWAKADAQLISTRSRQKSRSKPNTRRLPLRHKQVQQKVRRHHRAPFLYKGVLRKSCPLLHNFHQLPKAVYHIVLHIFRSKSLVHLLEELTSTFDLGFLDLS